MSAGYRAPASDIRGSMPGWTLRALFAAIALPFAVTVGGTAPWPEISVALVVLAVARPRWFAAWVLIGVLSLSTLAGPGTPPLRLAFVIAAAHALHLVASWTLVVPVDSRLQPAVLLPGLRRFALVQLPVQAVALVLPAIGRPAGAWADVVAGAALVLAVVLLAGPLLRRPDR